MTSKALMNQLALRLWREDDGVLSFEWTMVLTLLVIGIVAGLAAARDGIIDELGDTAQAMLALDGSFVISQPLTMAIDPEGDGGEIAVGGASARAGVLTTSSSARSREGRAMSPFVALSIVGLVFLLTLTICLRRAD